ncbi:LuxR C-terminal-related transcriptional regulator [Terrabacter sp. MAHUQ-38]|uniref:ATP-binding protein n=1 Tax=unclassified Terrabacter TaxID=2630222 RepID=UPI00165D5604|nr:LuxR C-terminal-related transcriptional regulator [Terrabacter sp. MAHUQ-38]MBC9824015.1 LuxR family transcriptional regulator [Terrabacter sp. MAHUQ-38]
MTIVKSEIHKALPPELTSFVGRRQELGEIRQLLSGSRLVTLTGVGGVGKTRLALRTAATVRRAFPDGVWFIELAALNDPQLLPHTVASALDLHHLSQAPLADLAEHLQDKQLLVVLDNCEHLTDACAVVVGKLLAAAPGLHVLATSRHVLGVEGEQVLAVPPLSMPRDAAAPAGAVSHYEAVALLMDRARAVDREFQFTEENRDMVVELCRRLDGLPLALELAAVWLRTLSPAEILERLADRFELLTSGRRGGPARQHALEAAVAWSFDLCSPEEQLLWARLSVFSGGFDLEAVEEVCAGEGIAVPNVLPALAGLVDKSIVGREHDMEHGASWYRMLETIRQYGARRLSPRDACAIRLRHRERYRKLAAAFAAEFFTPDQAEWYVRMSREHGNFRAALDFCLSEPGEAAAALDIAAPLWPWWHAGHLHEGYRYLLRGLELATEPTHSRGYGLFATSNLAIHLSEFDRALALLAEAAALADRSGDELLSARVKQCQGHAQLHSGHPAVAIPLLEAAREDSRRLGQPRDEWRNVHLHSLALMFLGDLRAEDISRQAVELAEEHGAQSSKGWALWGLGLAQWRAGQYEDATRSQRDGIRLFLPMRNLNGVSVCVEALAWCAASSCPDERAARLLGASEAVWRTIGGNASQAVYRQFDWDSEEQVRSAIGDRRFDAAFAEGAAYSADQAVALALSAAPADRGTSRAQAPPGSATPGGLTRREWEIAQLLAEGLSNKDIAARLVIAPRTAETHVEHILTKLGFTSRTQASAWVVEQQGR